MISTASTPITSISGLLFLFVNEYSVPIHHRSPGNGHTTFVNGRSAGISNSDCFYWRRCGYDHTCKMMKNSIGYSGYDHLPVEASNTGGGQCHHISSVQRVRIEANHGARSNTPHCEDVFSSLGDPNTEYACIGFIGDRPGRGGCQSDR